MATSWTRLCVVVATALVMSGPTPSDCFAQESADHAQAAASESAAHAEGGAPNPLAVDLDLAVWSGVVFVVLFLVLSKFAWPQIVKALEERERKIADNIAAAEAKHQDAKRLLAEYDLKLAAAAGEVRALLDQARRDAEQTKNRIVAEARQAAEDEKLRAVREIERAKDGALHELAITSANLAIDLGRQVVREQFQVSPDYQARLVRDALGKLAAAAPGKN